MPRKTSIVLLVLATACLGRARGSSAQTATQQPARTGADIYQAACAACHAPDGRGQARSVVGFDTPLPDFTDCAVTTPEPHLDWESVVHMGGRVRALDRRMPSFVDALSDDEISSVVDYVQSFCTESGWPRGDLNFPRAFLTEKAYPENETIFTVNMAPAHPRSVESRIDYEHRIGKRAQYEIGVPFDLQQGESGRWTRGIGDVNVAYRYSFFDSLRHGSIAAAGGEITLPTGKETEGLGGGVTIFEGFGMWDQTLPSDGFIQFHAGFELPANNDLANKEVYWRTAIGKTYAEHIWGRAWSPMIEVVGVREFGRVQKAEWDVVPQMQVSLSGLQHILVNAGLRLPVNARGSRGKAVMVYLLWDWFDGGFFSNWRTR